MSSFRRRFLFPILSLGLALLAIELILQAGALLLPRPYERLLGMAPLTLPDSILHVRPNPNYPGNDERGFRSAAVPTQVAIVGMGDSQTYGMGVKREEAWPHQLETLARQSVYNMSSPGWCPTQSLSLVDSALALKPKLIIVAFYSGNDLYDAFANVYYARQFPELKTTNPHDSLLIGEAEAAKTLKTGAGELQDRVLRPWEQDPTGPSSAARRLKGWLGEHVRVYQMLRAARDLSRARFAHREWQNERLAAEAQGGREEYLVVDQGDRRTLLTPKYRRFVIDLGDPRVAEGHRIALEALSRISERAKAANTAFLVLLIPTKELVYKETVLAQAEEPSKSYSAVLENEELMWQRTRDFLDARGVGWVDALPALRARVQSGPQPYPASSDGHPNAEGYRAMAEVILAELKRRGLTPQPLP